MKKIIVFLLSCVLIAMTGCNQIKVENDNSQTSFPNSEVTIPSNENTTESSVSESELPTKIDTTLIVPINIVTANDNAEAYETSKVERDFVAGTEADIKAYANWINNLSGNHIKALYGESMPVFEYRQKVMGQKDSQIVFDKLRAVTKDLYVLPKFENPYTGGGWTIAIHTDDGVSTIFFNGGWLVVDVAGMDKGFKFNLEETDGQKLCNEINNILRENMQSQTDETIYIPTYKDKQVTEMYAVDTENYVMAQLILDNSNDQLLKLLEKLTPTEDSLSGKGYLLYTSSGKEYVYLDNDEKHTELNSICEKTLSKKPLHPSWLIHFTPERVVSVDNITDKEKIEKFCDFLKNGITVEKMTNISEHAPNPGATMGDFFFKINFDSDVSYYISGTDYQNGTGCISIYTSDLKKKVSYNLANGVAKSLTKQLEILTK